MELTGYGRSTGFCVDPIEKKPLNHFLPGSSVLSFGTAGCNLACAFCQNWDISKSRETARLSSHALPDAIARAAENLGCASVAYTYNDPTIFLEYAVDTAEACRARGIRNVAVTAGFICDEPRKRLFAAMDAANVDLKAFTERFYEKRCAGRLEPVLETLKYLVHQTSVWTEITTLLIPGENDGDEELDALTKWVAGSSTPTCRCTSPPSTPTTTCATSGRRRFRPAAGAGDRARERPASRLCRQPQRSGARGDRLPDLRDALHRARPLRHHRVWARRRGPLSGLRDENGRRVRRRAGKLGLATPAGARSSATRREASNGGRGACVTGKRGSAGGRAGCPQTRSGEFWYAATREDDGAALSSRRSTSRRAWRSSPARRSACPLRQADNDGIQSRAI